jgi:hypothetical protein
MNMVALNRRNRDCTDKDRANLNKPIENCYWVNPHLLASEYPGHQDLAKTRFHINKYLDSGLSCFIDLTQPKELEPYDLILSQESQDRNLATVYRRKPIVDYSVPSRNGMARILDTIQSDIQTGHKVVVHCWGGVGRTGTVIGCYLVGQGLSGEESLRELSQYWSTVGCLKRWNHPITPQSEDQFRMILDWNQ